MNMIFKKGEVPSDFRKAQIKPLNKKGDKSECSSYRYFYRYRYSIVYRYFSTYISIGRKLPTLRILFFYLEVL